MPPALSGGAPEAVVVGAGPNGLAAAITLARAGVRVLVREGAASVGGSARSAELTEPGFIHDTCSSVHPLGVASPFFRSLPLAELGVAWLAPEVELAHPLDGRPPALLVRSVDETAARLGRDGAAWARLLAPLAAGWRELVPDVLAPLHVPRHPLRMARFGLLALRSARGLVDARLHDDAARALFAGIAAHAALPLDRAASAAFGLVLATAGHVDGWPFVRGGSQALSDALAAHLRQLGGEVALDAPVVTLREIGSAPRRLLDLTPRQVLRIAGDELPVRYRRSLERWRYGPGVFKVDWALRDPVPWRDAECRRAGTVHVGGTLEEIAAAEQAAWRGVVPERPFVVFAQPTIVDSSRAPQGRHVAWAYCHVPNGSTVDMTERIEAQVEHFAPGFRDVVLARSARGPRELESSNPNLVGGDIGGGAMTLGQLFFRPTVRLSPYATPVPGLFLCSSSTPPGGGVHGMCGYWAAVAALEERFGT